MGSKVAAEAKLTFAEHIQELRRRLMWSSLFVVIGAGVGFALHDTLLVVLQRPLNDTLYYTTPTGAFGFIIKICTVFGLITALPALTYHGFAYFQPLIKTRAKRILLWYVILSVGLAAAGILFAYFISLPAALHFLVNFGGGGIEAIITANEYFNFVLAYLAGFALLFELPLIMSFINRVKPLTPSGLLAGTRYVVLGSFIAAAIITPTPDPVNQLLMAVPIILLYFVSAGVIIIKNRLKRQPITSPEPEQHAPVHSTAAATSPHRISDAHLRGRNTAVPAYQQRPSRPSVQKRSRPKLISDFLPAPE